MNEDMTALEKELSELKRVIDILSNPNFIYRLRKHAVAYEAVLTRYATFKVNDRIQLSRTPVITEQTAPGWMSSKHFLVQGARGTVTGADMRLDNGKMWYGIAFDDESWIDQEGNVRPVRDRHQYWFGEDMLEPCIELGG